MDRSRCDGLRGSPGDTVTMYPLEEPSRKVDLDGVTGGEVVTKGVDDDDPSGRERW